MVPNAQDNTAANPTRFDWRLPVQCCRHATKLNRSNFMKGQLSRYWCQVEAEYCKSLPRPKQLNSHA
eukprot:8708761-Ditylum_brightwellii.AAC.1